MNLFRKLAEQSILHVKEYLKLTSELKIKSIFRPECQQQKHRGQPAAIPVPDSQVLGHKYTHFISKCVLFERQHKIQFSKHRKRVKPSLYRPAMGFLVACMFSCRWRYGQILQGPALHLLRRNQCQGQKQICAFHW